LSTRNFLENSLKKVFEKLKTKKKSLFRKTTKMNPNEPKRKREVIDLTNEDAVVHIFPDGKRVVISKDEEEAFTDCSDTEEEKDDESCCGLCGSEYERRDDSADVCEECYESERNMCHGCKEVFPPSEFLNNDEGFCEECYRSVLDKLDPLVQMFKK
jgi:hypothetical protein